MAARGIGRLLALEAVALAAAAAALPTSTPAAASAGAAAAAAAPITTAPPTTPGQQPPQPPAVPPPAQANALLQTRGLPPLLSDGGVVALAGGCRDSDGPTRRAVLGALGGLTRGAERPATLRTVVQVGPHALSAGTIVHRSTV